MSAATNHQKERHLETLEMETEQKGLLTNLESETEGEKRRSVEERFEAGEEKFGDISAHPHEHEKLKRELWEMEEHWGSLTDLMDEAEKEEKDSNLAGIIFARRYQLESYIFHRKALEERRWAGQVARIQSVGVFDERRQADLRDYLGSMHAARLRKKATANAVRGAKV